MKKILIINVKVIGENSGTGNTLKNLFQQFPSECIFQLCLDEKNSKNDDTIKNTIYAGNRSFPIDWSFRFLIKRLKQFKEESAFKAENNTSSLPSAIVDKSLKSSIHDCIRGFLDMSFIHFNKDILKAIDNFAPDVIYTCGTSIRNFKSVNYFFKRYNIKNIVHIMDDWPETAYTTSALSALARKSLKRELKKTLDNSVINFGISEELADKYEVIYKKRFEALMNPVSKIVEACNSRDVKPVKLVYAGALTLNRWKSIIEVGEIVKELNHNEVVAALEIYIPPLTRANQYCSKLEELGVVINDYVPVEQIDRVYDSSDILVHVESFDSNIISFTKYSLSTKIPEYMASGKPILAYLPYCLYGYNYINDRRIGLVASNKKELKENIQRLLFDNLLRKQLAENGLYYARKEHSISVVKEKITVAIKAACTNHRNKLR